MNDPPDYQPMSAKDLSLDELKKELARRGAIEELQYTALHIRNQALAGYPVYVDGPRRTSRHMQIPAALLPKDFHANLVAACDALLDKSDAD